jgi:hypothetical protein
VNEKPDKPVKTHREVKEPQISVRDLADYMAASERKRRTVVEACKYRRIARVHQHRDAPIAIAAALRQGTATPEALKERAAAIRAKIADDDFDAFTNETNADYVEAFAKVVDALQLPNAELLPGESFAVFNIQGTKVTFAPNPMLRRLIKKSNKLLRGALMLRYAKGVPLSPIVGGYQSAAAFGLLRMVKDEETGEPDKALCITLCALSGEPYVAPTNSVSIFHNMRAACATIAERWPAIKPPKGAIL